MKKFTVLPVILVCLIFASLAFTQEFPPTLNLGPFPFGSEEVRGDAPVDEFHANAQGIIHEYTAYRGTPTIDGDVENDAVWNSIPWTLMTAYHGGDGGDGGCYLFDDDCSEPAGWYGWDDISAWFKIMWDDENVYVAVKKVDDDYVFIEDHLDDTGSIWQDDAYQLVLDTRDAFDIESEGVSAEIGFSVLNWEDETFNAWRGDIALADGNCESASLSADGKAMMGSQVETDMGYTETIELAIVKWDEIVADENQLLSIMCNDTDEDHDVDALQFGQGIFSPKSVELYASIVYSMEEPPATTTQDPVFPPTLITGPFPRGTEEVRGDAPVDEFHANAQGIIHEYTAYKGTPTIDGNVENDPIWNAIPWTLMTAYHGGDGGDGGCYLFDDDCSEPAGWYGWDDIAAWFKILWDDENVYVAVRKVDDDYVFVEDHLDDTGSIWQDDAYQLVLDTRDAFDIESEGVSAEIGFSVLNWEDETFNAWRGDIALADGNCESASLSADGKAMMGSQVETDMGYVETIELAIVKWDEIVADENQLLSIMCNDTDEDHDVDALQFGQGIFSPKSVELYASIVYSNTAVTETAVEEDAPQAVVNEFALEQNYPNPFNPSTTIRYNVSNQTKVNLAVFDVKGRQVATLVNENQGAGMYNVSFDASNLSSGIYFYRLQTDELNLTKRMLYIK